MDGPTKDSYVLRLRGQGYHFESTRPKEVHFYEDLPLCRANLTDNGSLSAFSTESIDFGEIVQGEPSRRFVILYNLHPTQKMKFRFEQSSLLCGDNLLLEPMSGELKPNCHFNIKMTLTPGSEPTHFEGEVGCSIDWESDIDGAGDHISMHASTHVPESSEHLFLRIKKRSKITKV